jgi:thiol:disulfide interchange protein DsbC
MDLTLISNFFLKLSWPQTKGWLAVILLVISGSGSPAFAAQASNSDGSVMPYSGNLKETVENAFGDAWDGSIALEKLRAARPDFKFQLDGQSAIPGYLRVLVENGPTLYVATDGSHFFDGDVYQIGPSGFIDVEDLRFTSERKRWIANINADDMIVFSPKGEKRAIINVFTDIDCGYCRKMHREIDQLNAYGIEVRYLAYPRSGIDTEGYQKMVTAWCAPDRKDALTRMKRGEDMPLALCSDHPVDEHFTLGGKVGVTGTPSVVLMDGSMIPGYQPADALAEQLGLRSAE